MESTELVDGARPAVRLAGELPQADANVILIPHFCKVPRLRARFNLAHAGAEKRRRDQCRRRLPQRREQKAVTRV